MLCARECVCTCVAGHRHAYDHLFEWPMTITLYMLHFLCAPFLSFCCDRPSMLHAALRTATSMTWPHQAKCTGKQIKMPRKNNNFIAHLKWLVPIISFAPIGDGHNAILRSLCLCWRSQSSSLRYCVSRNQSNATAAQQQQPQQQKDSQMEMHSQPFTIIILAAERQRANRTGAHTHILEHNSLWRTHSEMRKGRRADTSFTTVFNKFILQIVDRSADCDSKWQCLHGFLIAVRASLNKHLFYFMIAITAYMLININIIIYIMTDSEVFGVVMSFQR